MKKRKLLFLLVIVLCASILFTACSPEEPKDPVDDPSDNGGDNPSGDQGGNEPEAGPEMLNWFVLDPTNSDAYYEDVVYNSLVKVEEGKTTFIPYEGFTATITEEIDKYDKVNVKLVLSRGETEIVTETASYLNGDAPINLDVDIDKNFILVTKTGGEDDIDTATVYFNNDAVTRITSGKIIGYGKTNSLRYVKTETDITWYDDDGRYFYSASLDFWNASNVKADYAMEGKLYWIGNDTIHVYANNSCIIEYLSTSDGPGFAWDGMHAYVLNDGNILVQECYGVDSASTEYDALFYGEKYNVVTKIINTDDCSIKEIENVNFLVMSLEPASLRSDYYSFFPFALTEGKENQALVFEFSKTANTMYGAAKYVVLNNNAEIEYVFNNNPANFHWELDEIVVVAEDRYAVPLIVGGAEQYVLYDLEGNVVASLGALEEWTLYNGYIVTESAIYDKDMNLIGSFAESDVEFVGFAADGKLLVTKDADGDRYEEYYFMDVATGKLTMVSDSLNTDLCAYGEGLYVVKEYCADCANHVKSCVCFECERHATHIENCTEYECMHCELAATHFNRCETYKFNEVVFGDGLVCGICNDSCNYCQNCIHKLYNVKGELLLTARGCIALYDLDDGYIAVEFEGDYIYYLLQE